MAILYMPSPYGPERIDPAGAIVHAIGEYIGGVHAPDFLMSRGESAHAFVTPNAELIVTREDTQGAWHCKAAASGPFKDRSFNFSFIGIEFMVPGDHDYTSFVRAIAEPWPSDAQLEVGARYLAERFARYPRMQEIYRHSDVNPAVKVDPGAGFNFERLKGMIWTRG